jgi:hypothetical protein
MLLQLVRHTEVILEWDLVYEEIISDTDVRKILKELNKAQEKTRIASEWLYFQEIIESLQRVFYEPYYIIDEADIALFSSNLVEGEYVLFLQNNPDDDFCAIGNLILGDSEIDQDFIEILTQAIEDYLNS